MPNIIEIHSDYVPVERITRGVMTIDSNHSHIHNGEAYSLSGSMTVVNAKVGAIKITPPAGTYVHLQVTSISTTGSTVSVSLLEDYSFTEVAESTLTPTNHNRVSSNVSPVVCKAYADCCYSGAMGGIKC